MRDVVIIGGGPVGVATAMFCHAQGLDVEVYERSPDVYPLPRAVALDDEIQRAFAKLGIVDELVAITQPALGAEFVNAARERIVGVDIEEGMEFAYGYHPVVYFHQPTLEQLLRGHLATRGIPLHLNSEVESVLPGDELVSLTIQRPDGTHTVSTRWVIAADGASSRTRKALGVENIDLGFDQEWVVVDVLLTDAAFDPNSRVTLPLVAQQICDPKRVTTFVPGQGRWRRWEFQVQPGESGADLAEPSRMAELLSPWLTPEQGSVERSAVYRFHATVADRMRAGHVFLAGDAAHQMPPFLGQGMCSGIRDGVNLAWKLALVKSGAAGDHLLDSYAAERQPHATGVVHHAIDTGKLIDHLATGAAVDDTSAGYGGTRPFPTITDGFVDCSTLWGGRQLPNPRLTDGSDERVDGLLGEGFSVLITSVGRAALPENTAGWFKKLRPHIVEVGADRFPFLLNESNLVVVRPDYTIAAVLDVTDSEANERFSELVAGWFGS